MAEILQFPANGRLLVATDLQGNLRDYRRMVECFREAMADCENAHLLFTGDLVHGPHISEDWPDFLGEYYRDESGAIIDEFVELGKEFPGRIHAILGNHEHGHIGGPHTAKFARDEVALLDQILGPKGARRIADVFRTFPLVARAPCGIVFTHGAPAADIRSLAEIEQARLDTFDGQSPIDILKTPVVGKILWARSARPALARRFLAAVGGRVSIYGHDVVPEGYERIGDEQMIISTSFGVFDSHKIYLQVDLSSEYHSVHDLRDDRELLPLYPDRAIRREPSSWF